MLLVITGDEDDGLKMRRDSSGEDGDSTVGTSTSSALTLLLSLLLLMILSLL